MTNDHIQTAGLAAVAFAVSFALFSPSKHRASTAPAPAVAPHVERAAPAKPHPYANPFKSEAHK